MLLRIDQTACCPACTWIGNRKQLTASGGCTNCRQHALDFVMFKYEFDLAHKKLQAVINANDLYNLQEGDYGKNGRL
jgi:hypothetical protein